MRDCPALSKKISSVAFELNSLKNIVDKYNQCVGATVLPPAEKQRVAFSVIGGARLHNSLKFGLDNYLAEEKFQRGSKGFLFGAGMRFGVARVNKNVSFTIQALYDYNLHFYSLTERTADDFYLIKSTERKLAVDYIRIPFLVRKSFGAGVVRPFAQLGFSNNFLAKVRSNEYNVEYINGSLDKDEFYTEGFRKYQLALVAGLGLELGKPEQRALRLEARLERTSPVADDKGLLLLNALLSYDITN